MARWWTGGSLVQRFAVLSFIVIGATTAALSLVISRALQNDMLAREWYVTSSYIRLQAREALRSSDFADPMSAEAQERFRLFYDNVMRMPEIIRVKIYDRTATVVWSDEPRLIGQRFGDNAQLAKAFDGHTVANLEAGKKKSENVFEEPPRLVELYVPLEIPPATGVTGIVETYKTPDQVFASIRAARRIVVGTALAGGALLWASLFGIVRAAARRIERQHRALEQHSRDLSAANEALHSVQAQLVAAGRMAAIGEVVSAVAHGIRNPLANIRGSAQLALLDCREGMDAASLRVNLEDVIGEVDRLGLRVSELLRFVRATERRSEPLDLNELLRRSLHTLRARAAEMKVDVVDHLAPALPVIQGDPVLLEQAFAGLVENALDAVGDEPGTLTLATAIERTQDGFRVFAEVEDTGVGIPSTDLGKIFDLFYTTKPQGTGLGLALAKKFIEAYDGTLTVRSSPDHGTVFRATFPVVCGVR